MVCPVTFYRLTTDVRTVLTFAQGDGGAGPADVNPLAPLIPMLVIGAFFYFIMMRPQQKEARRRKQMLAALKKNDKVVTIGGIIGTVVDLNDNRVTLRIDDSTRVKFIRSSIQSIYDEKAEGEAAG